MAALGTSLFSEEAIGKNKRDVNKKPISKRIRLDLLYYWYDLTNLRNEIVNNFKAANG